MTQVLWLVVLVCVVQCSAMSRDELEDFSNFLLKTSSLDLHVKKGADPDDAFDEGELVSDHAWEESGKFEGDLILNDRQRRLIVENVEGLSRNGLTDSTKRWPNNEVIYFIQREHFSSGHVQAIEAGIEDLERASCVKFRPYRKGDRDAVVIQGSRRGCFSQVGYQGGFQVLNLSGRHPIGRGCFRHGTVVHELLHTLGFYHMQSSPDRDDYIDVVWANIVQPARHNFRKYNSFSVSDFGVGYDYDSVLHYSRRAFSSNGQDTLVPKMSGAEIGQRVGLSDKDTQKLNKMYCDADNDHVQADETPAQKPKIKKKKPKNEPFQGQGIGYHQGKTVVIKLQAAQAERLPNVPSTRVFDFSTTPQVSTPEAGSYRFGKEVAHPYMPTISLNTEKIMVHQNSLEVEPTSYKNLEKEHLPSDDKVELREQSSKENNSERSLSQHSNDSNEVKPKYVPIDKYDKDLADAFHRLTKIVKQHVYPQNQDVYKINKDYSKFYVPLQPNKSHNNQDSLDEHFTKPIKNDFPISISQKQLDSKQGTHELDENINNQPKSSHLEDRMDISYRTSLPTKKPYSLYEQTETPHYATLEYLKNRHDYSNIYSPETSKDDTHSDYIHSHEGVKFKQDNIKINPYNEGFYTDYVKADDTGRVADASRKENISKQARLSRYELAETPITNKQLSLTGEQFKDRMDSSYRTLLPIKKPYSAYEQTETPNYATLEYLKNRHDFSNLYTPKNPDVEKRKESYTLLGGELPPTETDWYKKDSYKQNPADYDRDFYSDSDYTHQKRIGYRKGESKESLTDATNYNDDDDHDYDEDENSTETGKKIEAKYEREKLDEDFYTDYEKDNKGRLTDGSKYNSDEEKRDISEEKQNGEHYDYGRIDYDTDNPNDEEDAEEPPSKKKKLNHDDAKHNHGHYTDYEKEHRSGLSDASNTDDSDNENNKDSVKKSQTYKLYGAPVPLTKDWYRSNYSIPEITHDDKSSTSFEKNS